MSEISSSPSGKAKCEILRKVCFADVCEIRLSVSKILESLAETAECDYGELLKSMEAEFLVQINSEDSSAKRNE